MPIADKKDALYALAKEAVDDFVKEVEEAEKREAAPVVGVGQIAVRITGDIKIRLTEDKVLDSRAGSEKILPG